MGKLDKELARGVEEMDRAASAATELGDQAFERLTHGGPRSKVSRLVYRLMQGIGLDPSHKIRRSVDSTTENVLQALRKTLGQ